MNTDARNVTRNSLLLSALQSTMLGKRNARNAVGKNWNNSLRLFRRKPPERVSKVRNQMSNAQFQMPRRGEMSSKKVSILYYSRSGNTEKGILTREEFLEMMKVVDREIGQKKNL